MHQNSQTPSVSIVVAAFNAERYLLSAIRSALSQEAAGVEVIVVDDGSGDGTAAVAERASELDERVQLLRTANRGPGSARNAGVAVARGAFLCFLDADDILPPSKVRLQVEALRSEPGIDIVYSPSCRFLGEDSTPSEPVEVIEDGNALAASLLEGADRAFPVHAALVRRSAFESVGGFREVRPLVEDIDLWVRLAFAGRRFRFIPGDPVLYRKLPGSRSTRALEVNEGYLPVHRWLAERQSLLPPGARERLLTKYHYRTIRLAALLDRQGRRGEARRLLLRYLRSADRLGAAMECIRFALFPGTLSSVIPGLGRDSGDRRPG